MASSTSLGNVASGRDNNFLLMRLIAASAVLLSHSYTLATGSSASEPLRSTLSMSLGDMAVDVFFATSGFLVAASLIRRASITKFLAARTLRIYPGLVVAVLFTVFVVGPLFTKLPLVAYLSSIETLTYLIRTSTLVFNVGFTLPGVFESNPWPHGVNASLWTLPYEISMYALLATLSSVMRRRASGFSERMQTASVIIAFVALLLYLVAYAYWRPSALLRLTAMFWSGVAYYFLRDRIKLSWPLAIALLTLLASTSSHEFHFHLVYGLALPYLVLCASYLPGGRVRLFNRFGDYSYGIYIYGFPIQQCVTALLPNASIGWMFALSLFVTFILALGSWHLIEKPFLSFKMHRVDTNLSGIGIARTEQAE